MFFDDNPNRRGFKEIGDIDVPLIKNDTIIALGEAKAFSTFLGYAKEKALNKYTKQLTARLKRFVQCYPYKIKKDKPGLELTFIVYQFQFKGFEESIAQNDSVKEIYCSFKKEIEKEAIELKVEGTNINFNPEVKLLAAQCIIDHDNNKLANFSIL